MRLLLPFTVKLPYVPGGIVYAPALLLGVILPEAVKLVGAVDVTWDDPRSLATADHDKGGG